MKSAAVLLNILSLVVYSLFTIGIIKFYNNMFIFEAQEGFLKVRKIYKYQPVQYHIGLLIYKIYTIIMYECYTFV